jgi:hypothetical protein
MYSSYIPIRYEWLADLNIVVVAGATDVHGISKRP